MQKGLSKLLTLICVISLLITMPGAIVTAAERSQTTTTADENLWSAQEEITGKSAGFSDVQNKSHPYYKAIYWAADAGITKGYPNGTFGINRSCTRGEMIMFLWRYANKPKPENVKKIPFKDVPKNHAFCKAILWAAQKGITKGYSDGTFGINRNVSRGECMMFLWRVNGKPAPEVASKSPFKDVPKNHVFYKAILWGAQNGITKGYTTGKKKGSFGINDDCTRGQIVTFIYRIASKQAEPTDPPVDEPLKDTDKDGISDQDEKSFGTDPDKADTDSDGLSDYEESLLGTDPIVHDTYDKTSDTDGDGLTDYDEAKKYHTDPYSADTDGDGLTDFEEISTYHTDPLKADSDGDSLSDQFEIEHGLDPNSRRSNGATDDSNVKISQELPSSAISDLLLSTDNLAIPSIDGTAKGDMENHIFISSAVDATVKENRAVIGNPIFIDSNDDYVAGLNLNFDLSRYEGELSSLLIVTLDDDDNYIPVDTSLSGDSLYARIDKSGTYFVLDIDEFLASLGIDLNVDTLEGDEILIGSGDYPEFESEIPDISNPNAIIIEHESEEMTGSSEENTDDAEDPTADAGENGETETAEAPVYEEISEYNAEVDEVLLESLNAANEELVSSSVSGQADIVFAIDTTGSMASAINNVVTNVTSFATTLSKNYNVQVNYALIDFKDLEEDGPGTTIVVKNGSSNWFSDVNAFVGKVQTLAATGGGDTPECDIDALETARRLNWRTNSDKFIILITDTYYKTLNDYGIGSMEEEIELLRRDGIHTSVVSDSYYQSTYQDLYTATGGIFTDISYSSFSSSLLALADMIGETTSDGTWVILKHGYRYVKLTDEPDQDSDGLSTEYELGTLENVDLSLLIKAQLAMQGVPFEQYVGKTSIPMYRAKSDPTTKDTDNDGIDDKKDTAPWKTGLKDGVVGAIKICSYGDGAGSSAGFGGHAYVAYTSFIESPITLYGIKVNSADKVARQNDTRTDRPCDHTFTMESDDVISIGGWAGWLPDELKGSWINNEYYLFSDHVNGDQTSLMKYITFSQREKMASSVKAHSKWTCLYNCSAFAADVWNDTLDDTISPNGPWASPRSLAYNIQKRTGYKIADPMHAEWP